MNDTEIIKLLKKDSPRGMEELIEKYGGLVKYIITNILGNHNKSDIEECLWDVFYEFWQQIDDYDANKGSVKNYLVGIGRYMALNRYRSLSRYQQRNVPIEEDTIAIESDEDLEGEVIESLKSTAISEVLLEMKQPDRDIFIRRYFWFEKVKDIAKALKLDNKQVENRLYKGRERLKKQLIKKGVDLS